MEVSWGVRVAIRALFLIFVALPRMADAQSNFVRPALDWMTVRTRYFDVYYPAPMAEWVRDLTARLDAVHDAVSALVGYAPRARVRVIVEDPINDSNGFANPPLGEPLIVFWPTPPDPAGWSSSWEAWSRSSSRPCTPAGTTMRTARRPGRRSRRRTR